MSDHILDTNKKVSPAMTDHAQVDVAEQVIRDVHKELPEVWLGGRQRYVLVEAITKALTQAHVAGRREELERLKQKPTCVLSESGYMCSHCGTTIRADNPDWTVIDELKAELVAMTNARDEAQGEQVKLWSQLAASQARCRELEKEIGSPNETCTYAWDRKERIRMKRVIEDFCIAEGTLQATLAAREAVIGQQEATIKGYRHSIKIIGQQHDDRKAERDAAVQEARRLRRALAILSQLGGTRSEGNMIAQRALDGFET